MADVCGGLLPLQATERTAYKVTLLLGYLVFHSSLVQALPSSSSCNPLLSKPCPPPPAPGQDHCLASLVLPSAQLPGHWSPDFRSHPFPVYYFTILLLLLFLSTMESVLLAGLLARGHLGAKSSPSPAPRGEQQDPRNPGPNPEGGQGLGPFLRVGVGWEGG